MVRWAWRRFDGASIASTRIVMLAAANSDAANSVRPILISKRRCTRDTSLDRFLLRERPLGPTFDELLDDRIRRPLKLFGRSFLDDFSVEQHGHTVGDL